MLSRMYSKRFYGVTLVSLMLLSVFVVVHNMGHVDAQGNWWNSSWSYRKMITIDGTKVSANISDFPVLIDITDADLISKARSDGEDIVFTDSSGLRLNHEIESYDISTGHLICWVNTDLSSNTDTILYMYYGNPSASNQENQTAVWNPGYGMVQHMAESAMPAATNWHKYEGNPILNGSQNGFASVFYDNNTGLYHLFCSWGSILHFTSSNGITGWVADANNPVLSGNNEGVPMVWKENGTWYMIYRYGSPDRIGLANSTDATHWTRYEGNPILYEGGSFMDPWGVIKVDSTYYLWYNDGWSIGSRCAGLATSTDLLHWTKDPNNPIFTGGRFCVFPFKYGSYFYMLVPHYTTSSYGEIELYRDVNPTFYEGSREYLGVVVNPGPVGSWDQYRFDTPCVLTDTIYRDTYTAANNQLWMYYASTPDSGGDWWTGMCIEQNITDALTRIGATAYSHFDSTANHNNGQASGNLRMNVTGQIDGADQFDGVSSYVDCGDSESLKGMTALTVEAWVRPDLLPPSGTGIVAKWSSWAAGTGGSYILWQGGTGKVGWGVITETSTVYLYDTPVLQPGQWYHLVGTYDGSQTELYINGAQAGTPTAITGKIASTNDPCYIGRYTTPYFNGTIDEVRISNVSRSAAWILTEYTNQLNPSAFYSLGFEETQVQAKLSVNPSLIGRTPEDVGTTFAVNITIANVTDLFGFDFNLTWDGSLIQLVGVDLENQLNYIWGSGNWVMVKNQTASGWYKLVAVSTVSSFSSTAERPLARLTFQVESFFNWQTETNLHFAVVKLSDSHANPITVNAEDGTYMMAALKPSVDLSPSTVLCRKYGERFKVSVNLNDAVGVSGFAFELYYNSSLLDYVGSSDVWGDLGTGALTVNESAGTLNGSVSSLTPVSGSHWLLNVTFISGFSHVWRNETLVPGWRNDQTGRIWLHGADLTYLNHTSLQYEEGRADQIVVTELEYMFSPIQGDVNNDGTVDVFDLRTVAIYYDANPSKPEWVDASKYDFNGDNIIDIFDLTMLAINFGYKYDC